MAVKAPPVVARYHSNRMYSSSSGLPITLKRVKSSIWLSPQRILQASTDPYLSSTAARMVAVVSGEPSNRSLKLFSASRVCSHLVTAPESAPASCGRHTRQSDIDRNHIMRVSNIYGRCSGCIVRPLCQETRPVCFITKVDAPLSSRCQVTYLHLKSHRRSWCQTRPVCP